MSVKFNGSTGYLEWNKGAGAMPVSAYPYSITLWARVPSTPSQQTLVASQSAASSSINSGYLDNFAYLNGLISPAQGVTNIKYMNASAMVGSTYRLVVLVFVSKDQVGISVNGSALVYNTQVLTDALSSHDRITIGGQHFNGAAATYFGNGDIAEVHFFNRALADADITTLNADYTPNSLSGWADGWQLKDATDLTSAGGRTLTLNGGVTSSGSHPITRTTTATAVTLSGPTSGTVGTASSNFTVGANGTITGTVTITPSDGGAGGTFSPATVNITSASPTATFTYTAASSGVKTISVTNNGSLTNPATISYTASVAAATSVTMSGPTSGAVGSPSTNFTIGANGAISGTVVVTPSDGGGGGSFSPTSVSISSATPTATFTYTPASTGAKTISVTNNGALTNPSSITYTASGAAATAVTLSGPTSGFVGSPSTNFSVGVNGTITGSLVVTPSAGAGGGTFSPTSLTLTAGAPSGTFTYTPASSGAKTISVTNNGSLTNPSSITYTANAIGTITGDPIKDEVGNSQAAVVIPKVVFMRISDMTVQLSLTNQTVNGSSLLPISNAALIPGTAYLRILCNADGSKVGAKAYTAA